MRRWLLILVLSGCAAESGEDIEVGSSRPALAATPDEVFPAVGVTGVPASADQLVPLPLHHVEMTRMGFGFHIGDTAEADGSVHPPAFDPIVRTYAEAGVWMLPVVGGSPPEILANLPAWERFNTTLAERYGPSGSFWRENPGIEPRPIRIWEVFNEPNLPLFWGGEPNPDHYRRLLRHAFIGLRRGDPRARVMLAAIVFTQGNGTAWRPYLRSVLDGPTAEVRRNNRCLFDAVSVHPYAETVHGTIREMTKLRRVLEEEGVIGDGPNRDVQMWVTEIGWGLRDVCRSREENGDRCLKFIVADESAQERRMRREIDALQDRAGRFRLGAITWYTFQDLDPSICTGKQAWWCHAGLWPQDMSRQRPGWAALGQAAEARGMRRLPPVRCAFDEAGLTALAADDATDGGGL